MDSEKTARKVSKLKLSSGSDDSLFIIPENLTLIKQQRFKYFLVCKLSFEAGIKKYLGFRCLIYYRKKNQ